MGNCACNNEWNCELGQQNKYLLPRIEMDAFWFIKKRLPLFALSFDFMESRMNKCLCLWHLLTEFTRFSESNCDYNSRCHDNVAEKKIRHWKGSFCKNYIYQLLKSKFYLDEISFARFSNNVKARKMLESPYHHFWTTSHLSRC